MNLRSYCRFLNFLDTIWSTKRYLRAGKGLLNCSKVAPDIYPADKARKLAKDLIKFHPNDRELQEMTFDLYLSEDKVVLALKSLILMKGSESYYTKKD